MVAWGKSAERLNELADSKGLAVVAIGMVSQRRWKYNDKWYERLELIYLSHLKVQVGDDFEAIAIEKRGEAIKEAVASAVNAKPKGSKKDGSNGDGAEEVKELEPDDIPF